MFTFNFKVILLFIMNYIFFKFFFILFMTILQNDIEFSRYKLISPQTVKLDNNKIKPLESNYNSASEIKIKNLSNCFE